MNKKITSCILSATLLLTLTGCGNENTSSGTSSSSGDVIVAPELYNVRTVFEQVYSKAGYTYAYNTPAEGEAVLEAYVSTLGLSWRGVLNALTSKNPATDTTLMALCKDVGISTSEVDWTTCDTVYSLPNTTPAAPLKVNLTQSRDAFIADMQDGAFSDYRESIKAAGGVIPGTASIDANVFAECLNVDMTMSRIADKYTKYTYVNPEQLMFKPTNFDSSFYTYTERNGHSYIAYFPTVCNLNNAGKYLAECDGDTGIPLWQEYFISYAQWCHDNYGVNLTEGIYNSTNDGIEVWWPTSDGYSLELDVYESGLIRIVRSSDSRYDSYSTTIITKDPTIPDTLYDYLRENFGLNRTDVEAIYKLAQIFELECFKSEKVEDWKDAATVYVRGFNIIGDPDAYTKYTVGDILGCFAGFMHIRDPEKQYSYDSAISSKLLSELTNAELVANYNTTMSILSEINATNSTVNIAHFNSATSKVIYVKPDDLRMNEYKQKWEALVSDELVKWTLEKWVSPIMSDANVTYALANKWASINYDEFCPLIDKMESLSVVSTDTFGEYFSKLKDLSTFGRSDIIYTSVYSISDLPTEVLDVKINSNTSLEVAYPVIKELSTAIGYSGANATDVANVFERKPASQGGDSSSGSGTLIW